jgi:hypothetical protein
MRESDVVNDEKNLASYRRCVDRIAYSWEEFQQRRQGRLREQERFAHAAERATEGILEDLFTIVLDWAVSDVNHQIGHADIVLTRLGIKYLVVEAKRPGGLAWNQRGVEAALAQARRYADEQRVPAIAVSDGHMFYAADLVHGTLRDRVYAELDASEPHAGLWWLSVDGIYREPPKLIAFPSSAPSASPPSGRTEIADETEAELLHPKYGLPAGCFAYVESAADTHTWHLPYRLDDGSVDVRRLPKAVQAIVSNYRGARLSSVPEPAIPDVLVTLARAASEVGKMPHQTPNAAAAYVQLAAVLVQLGRLGEITEI